MNSDDKKCAILYIGECVLKCSNVFVGILLSPYLELGPCLKQVNR